MWNLYFYYFGTAHHSVVFISKETLLIAHGHIRSSTHVSIYVVTNTRRSGEHTNVSPEKKYACERERAYAVATANDHK